MGFESILGFIAIAIISSLLNKDKSTRRRSDYQNRNQPLQEPIKKVPNPYKRASANMSNSSKTRERKFSGGLEELFKDLKVEFDKNFSTMERKQSNSAHLNQDTISEGNSKNINTSLEPSKTTLKDETNLIKDSICEGEIGKEKIPIGFDRRSIVQGIIMSEILQKPKSLRR